MKIIDNINDLLGDDLKNNTKRGAALQIAAANFSIYAYEALKNELEAIDEFNFIFTSPTFTLSEQTQLAKREHREFEIPKINRERGFYGSEFEVHLKNKLT